MCLISTKRKVKCVNQAMVLRYLYPADRPDENRFFDSLVDSKNNKNMRPLIWFDLRKSQVKSQTQESQWTHVDVDEIQNWSASRVQKHRAAGKTKESQWTLVDVDEIRNDSVSREQKYQAASKTKESQWTRVDVKWILPNSLPCWDQLDRRSKLACNIKSHDSL